MEVQLSEDLVEFLESGVSMLVGSRDAALRPACTRALGVKVGADRRTVTVFLSASLTARMQSDFADNGRIAACFSRPIDHRTIQLKGRVLAVRPTTDSDRAVQDRYLGAFAEQVAISGLPRSVVRRVKLTPGIAVDFVIDDVFLQTPGPGAGRRLEADA